MLKAVLFDLDGVITDTAKYHYLAWKQMAMDLGIEINEEFNESLKGVDRYNSLLKILELGNLKLDKDKMEELMEKKNTNYLKMLESLNQSDILPGIYDYFQELRESDIKISIASASKNAPFILDKLGLIDQVDYIASPELAKASKPDPDIFILAAKGINVEINECIGIEDSNAGIQALNEINCKSIAIGAGIIGGSILIKSTSQLTLGLTKGLYEK